MVCRIKDYKIYYINRDTGNDNNTGETEADAWATLDYAINSVRNKSLGYGGGIELQLMAAGTYICPDLSTMRELYITAMVSGVIVDYQSTNTLNAGTIYNLECQFLGLTLELRNGIQWTGEPNINIQTCKLDFINTTINGSIGCTTSIINLGGSLPSGGSGSTTIYAKADKSGVYVGSGSTVYIGEDNCAFMGTPNVPAIIYEVRSSSNISNGILVAKDKLLSTSTMDISYESLKHDTNLGYYATVKTGIGTPNGIDVKQSQQTSNLNNTVPVLVNRTPTSDDPRAFEVVYKPFLDSYKEIRRFKSNFNYSEFPTMSGVVTFEMIKLGTEYYIRVADFIGYDPKGVFIESDCLYNNIDSNNECNMTQYVFEAYYHSFLCTAYTTRVRLSQVNEMTSEGEWHYNINASMSFGKRAQSNQLSIYLRLNNSYHHCVIWGTLKLSESPWIQIPDDIPKTF